MKFIVSGFQFSRMNAVSVSAGSLMIMLLGLCPMVLGADPDDKPAPLPPEIQRVVDEHDEAVAKAKQAFEAAVAKADADGVKKMEKVQKELMRGGSLEGANLAQKQIDDWKPKEHPVEINCVGRYRATCDSWNITELTLGADGKAMASNNTPGTWVFSNQVLTITWYNGNTNKGTYDSKSFVMVGDKGATFTLSRE